MPHFGQRFSPSVDVANRALARRVLPLAPLPVADQEDRERHDGDGDHEREQLGRLVHVAVPRRLVPCPRWPDHAAPVAA